MSVPEGRAASFLLVRSRLHPGKFYALPKQAPAASSKQLLMVSGLTYSISKIRRRGFRDEKTRVADRSPTDF